MEIKSGNTGNLIPTHFVRLRRVESSIPSSFFNQVPSLKSLFKSVKEVFIFALICIFQNMFSENDANLKQFLLRNLYRIKLKDNGNSMVIFLVKSIQRVSFALLKSIQ